MGLPAFIRARPWLVIAAAVLLVCATIVVGFAVFSKNLEKESSPLSGQRRNSVLTGADASPRLRLLVPAYFYPAGESLAQWERLLESPDPTAVVVIANPDSGPGKVADPNYVRVIDRARQKGFLVIGYVSTRYATRPIADVKEDIDRWVRFYPGVRGERKRNYQEVKHETGTWAAVSPDRTENQYLIRT